MQSTFNSSVAVDLANDSCTCLDSVFVVNVVSQSI